MAISYKSSIGKEDIKWWDGKDTTFTRETSTGGTVTLTKYGHMVDVAHVYGNGSINADILSKAIKNVGNNTVTFLITPGTWTIDSNLTIPSNCAIYMPQGAVFNISSGVTLTINGSFQAGLYQVFSGDGSVSFGSGSVIEVYPEWFGAVADNSTDCTTALNKAVICAGNMKGGIIKLSKGTYVVSDKIEIKAPVNIEGVGKSVLQQLGYSPEYASTIKATHSGDIFNLNTTNTSPLDGTTFRNFNITSTGDTKANGFHFEITNFNRNFYFENMGMYNLKKMVYISKKEGATVSSIGLLSFISCYCKEGEYFIYGERLIQINVLYIHTCDIAYFTQKIISIIVESGSINGNCFEGSPSLAFSEMSRGIIIDSNYFEANTGTITISGENNVISKNYYYNVSNNIRPVVFGKDFIIDEPCNVSNSLMDSEIDTLLGDTSSLNILGLSNVYIKKTKYNSSLTLYSDYYGFEANDKLIVEGINIPAYTADVKYNRFGLSVTLAQDEYLVLYVKIVVNSGTLSNSYLTISKYGTDLTYQAALYNLINTTGKIYDVVLVFKEPDGWSGLYQFLFYPSYGNTVNVTRSKSYFLKTTDITTLKGELPLIHFRKLSSAPSEGTWAVGDIVYNISPSAGGYIGWVCVTAGTPGTWKGFGTIES